VIPFCPKFHFLAIRKTEQTEIDLPTEKESLRNIDEKTPHEIIDNLINVLRTNLAEDLLNSIKKREPEFFEKLVLEVLSKMGYGADTEDAILHTGKSGDGGIDGIIKQDKLGLDAIYIQAKKYESSIQEPALRDFAGALLNKRGIKKGIFITTSTFSEGAREYVKTIDHKIVLIDGHQLANLMIKYNIGVSTSATYEIKNIDNDYFEE
jgi:restriction system protein